MMQFVTCLLRCRTSLLLLAIALAPASWVVAGETVRVSVASGRVFLAQVDPTSDAEQLRLRFGSNRAAVGRSVA